MTRSAALREARALLDAAGLQGSFLVRDLDTGDEVALEPDLVLPLASVVKLPLAVAVSAAIERGELRADAQVVLEPDPGSAVPDPASGPTGTSRFRHRASVAIEDLLQLAVPLSDNRAADALFTLVTPAQVHREVEDLGVRGISVRHAVTDLTRTLAESLGIGREHLAHALAAAGNPLRELDPATANTGTARALTDLLTRLWRPEPARTPAAERVRGLLAANVHRQRLAPDLRSDGSRWSSKTGTLLNLRHEVGVVEHSDGTTVAISALTRSRVPAVVQPAAEATMGQVARLLHDDVLG